MDGPYAPTDPLIGTLVDGVPRDDLELALKDIAAALGGYDHAREYDDINLWEQNLMSREGRTLRQADIEFDSNFCSPVIDAVNDRLIITSVTATAGTAADAEASKTATAAVNAVMKANELDSRYRDWNRRALRDGDAYIIVWPAQEESPAAFNELTGDTDITDGLGPDGTRSVNITYADPRTARMFYDPENPRRKLFFAYQWQTTLAGEKKPRTRINLMYADRIEKWISAPGKSDAKGFSPFLDPDDDGDDDYPGSGADDDDDTVSVSSWPMPNPYGEVCAFHLRTAYEYGLPEHRNAFAAQDGISKLIEMMMVTVEFNGWPQRYAIQEADSLGNQSIREDPLAEHSPADWDRDVAETGFSTTALSPGMISNETGSSYEANPGGMMLFKAFKEVGQFQTANPAAFLDPIKNQIVWIATTTATPMWKFQGLGGQTPSGEALRIAEMPLVQKAVDRQVMLGATHSDVYECALRMFGITAQVKVNWANPATSDIAAVWDLVKQKVELGVPRNVAFMQAGVSEAEAAEWAKLYDDVFAEAEMQQGRARRELAQADLLEQQAIAAKIANGIPQRVALIEARYTEAEVDGWLADREQELGLGRRISLLKDLGAAIQSIGSGVSLGVLDAPAANAVIAALMGELIPSVADDVLMLDEEDEAEPEPPPGPLFGAPGFPPPLPLPTPPGGQQPALNPAG